MTSSLKRHPASISGRITADEVAQGPVQHPAPVALHTRIRDDIRRTIMVGGLKAHERVPSESALMSRFGVSRITVRQALKSLQSEGLIFTLQGKGSFVSSPKKADQHLARLEGLAEAMGAAGHEVANEVLAITEMRAPPLVAERLRLSARAAVTEIRRIRHLDRAPLSYEVTYVPAAIGARLAGADLARRDIFVVLENDLAQPLGRAELAIEAAAADDVVAGHLGLAPGAPILRIERLTHTADGVPIDFEYLFYRGSSFRYRLTLERRAGG